jgi:hypothetical protein
MAKKKADKYERCVLSVKERNKKAGVKKAVNPWAVCRVSVYGRNK